jgi:hypothetical protein
MAVGGGPVRLVVGRRCHPRARGARLAVLRRPGRGARRSSIRSARWRPSLSLGAFMAMAFLPIVSRPSRWDGSSGPRLSPGVVLLGSWAVLITGALLLRDLPARALPPPGAARRGGNRRARLLDVRRTTLPGGRGGRCGSSSRSLSSSSPCRRPSWPGAPRSPPPSALSLEGLAVVAAPVVARRTRTDVDRAPAARALAARHPADHVARGADHRLPGGRRPRRRGGARQRPRNDEVVIFAGGAFSTASASARRRSRATASR